METERIAGLLIAWAALEQRRSPFQVAGSERERTIPSAVSNSPDVSIESTCYPTAAP
jgi:hypothetical protein